MRLFAFAAACVAALSLAACGSVQASGASDLKQRAQTIVDDALERTQTRYPGCQPGSGAARPTFGRADGAPSAWLSSLIGVLGRPQTTEEAAFAATVTAGSRFFPYVGDPIYADATRLVTLDDGARFAITVAQSVPNSTSTAIPYDRCIELRHRVLRRLLRGVSNQLRRRAHVVDKKLTREGRPGPTPPDALGIASVENVGLRFGGPMTATWFRAEGLWSIGPLRERTIVFGLVPDGVASVRIDLGDFKQQAAVHDNTFSITLAHPTDSGVPDRILWLNAAGAKINTFEPGVASAEFASPA